MRRRAILVAARRLLEEVGTSDFSLSELARRSRISKANIYRYFESREEVLLQLWVEEVRLLGERLKQAFGKLAHGDVPGVISAIVAAFAGRPELCELMSIASPVLERHLSTDATVRAKENLATISAQIAHLLHEHIKTISLEDCGWLASATATWIAGIWPAVNPPLDVVQALRPEVAAMQPAFERDLTRLLTALIKGLAQGADKR